MKNLKQHSLAVIIALFFATGIFAQNKKANNIDDSKIGLQGYSPVSYLDLGLAQRGIKEYKSIHEGIAYYFTSKEQKKKFEKNPEKYMPAYGGYCAFGIYAGAKFRIDPNKFIVDNGTYYLFLNDVEVDAMQLWKAEKNKSKLVSTANKNWSSLKTK
ncbi:YHS domain-containing (seleno)protein [Aquimarina rhabdastrellae]